MKSTPVALLLVSLLVFAPAIRLDAQPFPATGGEASSLVKCFYECKDGPSVQGVPTFQEITTLMIANEANTDRRADVYYFNGSEKCVAHSQLRLSPVDLDELNVCHSLLAAGPVPPAGLVEIKVTDPVTQAPSFGVYAWGKNVLGKFRRASPSDNPEPFLGRVTGIGKYECRLVPYELNPQASVDSKCQGQTPPPAEVLPILVEQTGCACNADFNGSGTMTAVDATLFQSCFGQPATGACASRDLDCSGGTIDNADGTIFQCQFQTGIPADPSCCPSN